MKDDTSTPPTESIERRTFLAGVGAAGLAGLAGCGGDGDGGDGSDPTPGGGDPTEPDQSTPATAPAPDSGGDTQTPGGGTESTDSGGGGCPAAPSSYERQPIPPAVDSDESMVSVEAPASDENVTFSPSVVFINHDPDRIDVRVIVLPDADMESVFSNPDLEVTDEYDLPSGARMTNQSQFDGQESAVVYLPRGSDIVQVNARVRSDECMDVMRPIRDHMVNSLEVL